MQSLQIVIDKTEVAMAKIKSQFDLHDRPGHLKRSMINLNVSAIIMRLILC